MAIIKLFNLDLIKLCTMGGGFVEIIVFVLDFSLALENNFRCEYKNYNYKLSVVKTGTLSLLLLFFRFGICELRHVFML